MPDQPINDRTTDLSTVVEALQAEVRYLREEMTRRDEAYREESRRKDHLLAAALERIPAIETGEATEPRESPESAEPRSDRGTPPEEQERRSWWWRVFGR